MIAHGMKDDGGYMGGQQGMRITRQGQYSNVEIVTWVSCRYQDHRADQGNRYREPHKGE
jgi:hypothetical protein